MGLKPNQLIVNGESSDIFPVQIRIDGAHYPVADTPGMDIEVDEGLIEAQSFKFWDVLHLKRRDGSETKW